MPRHAEVVHVWHILHARGANQPTHAALPTRKDAETAVTSPRRNHAGSNCSAGVGRSGSHTREACLQPQRQAHRTKQGRSRVLLHTPGTAGTRSHLAARESNPCALLARPRPAFCAEGEPTGPRPVHMEGTLMPPTNRPPCARSDGSHMSAGPSVKQSDGSLSCSLAATPDPRSGPRRACTALRPARPVPPRAEEP